MAATDLDICNIALGHLGITQPVTNITVAPSTKEEKACARLYAHARRTLLERYNWKFAERRAALVAATGITLDGWSYAYDLPANFLKARRIVNAFRNEATDQKIPFDIVVKDDGSARVLVCDLAPVTTVGQEVPILKYTIDVVTPTLFTSYFDHALSWWLADLLAMPLRVDVQTVKYVGQRAKLEIFDCLGDDASAEQPDTPPDAEHIRARS
jgi:hypothetical protein